jgi:hypothetical protein
LARDLIAELKRVDPTFNMSSYDFCALTITLQTTKTGLIFPYSFASDEYEEYVGKPFNDAFGFFVT